jgi:hypothetical protein
VAIAKKEGLEMAIAAQNGSQITHELWDSIIPGATDVVATLFTVPKGQAGKTSYHTNMVQAGQLPLGQSFEVLALSWNFLVDPAPEHGIALSKGYYQLIVSAKMWNEGHLFDLGGGSALHYSGPIPAVPVTADDFTTPGLPVSNNLKQLDRAIPIGAGEAFRVDFEWPVAPGQVKFWFKLHGRFSRSLN